MSTEYIAAAQIDVLIATNRRHYLSGHYQLTATFMVRPCVKSDMKDPIHQTIPSDVFCPGRTEADPYTVPNDLQQLIRRIQRLQNADEVDFVATLWSWWRHQPIPSMHPRVPEHELLRKFLKIRAEVLHIQRSNIRHCKLSHTMFFRPTLCRRHKQAKSACVVTSLSKCLTFMIKFRPLVITRALSKLISKPEALGITSTSRTDFDQFVRKE